MTRSIARSIVLAIALAIASGSTSAQAASPCTQTQEGDAQVVSGSVRLRRHSPYVATERLVTSLSSRSVSLRAGLTRGKRLIMDLQFESEEGAAPNLTYHFGRGFRGLETIQITGTGPSATVTVDGQVAVVRQDVSGHVATGSDGRRIRLRVKPETARVVRKAAKVFGRHICFGSTPAKVAPAPQGCGSSIDDPCIPFVGDDCKVCHDLCGFKEFARELSLVGAGWEVFTTLFDGVSAIEDCTNNCNAPGGPCCPNHCGNACCGGHRPDPGPFACAGATQTFAGQCCSPGAVCGSACCGGVCRDPSNNLCCADGAGPTCVLRDEANPAITGRMFCCPPNTQCDPAGFLGCVECSNGGRWCGGIQPITANGICCAPGQVCGQAAENGCCDPGDLCGDTCCPGGPCVDGVCCQNTSCVRCGGQILLLGEECCNGRPCPGACVNGICCPKASACGPVCCPSGFFCSDDNAGICTICGGTNPHACQDSPPAPGCCSEGTTCCGNGECCGAGTQCCTVGATLGCFDPILCPRTL